MKKHEKILAELEDLKTAYGAKSLKLGIEDIIEKRKGNIKRRYYKPSKEIIARAFKLTAKEKSRKNAKTENEIFSNAIGTSVEMQDFWKTIREYYPELNSRLIGYDYDMQLIVVTSRTEK